MNLNQITIPSKNLTPSVIFYEKLGLTLIVDALPNYVRFECPEGESTFSIHKVDSVQKGNGTYIYFECENLDKKVFALIEQGFEFEEMPTDKSWLWREARLHDPDGHMIILYHAGENRKNPPWRVKG